MSEGHGMVEVHSLAFSFGTIGVDQNDLGGKSAQQQGVGEGRAHTAGADDGDAGGVRMVTGFRGSGYGLSTHPLSSSPRGGSRAATAGFSDRAACRSMGRS